MAAAGLVLFFGGPSHSQTLPAGGEITRGTGSITRNESSLTVNQQSTHLSIDWKSFSIGSNGSVRFAQPGANAVALNRVLGSEASRILGRLSANGQIFLINPHGVIFGESARVDVGGLVASTLGMSEEPFRAGRYILQAGNVAGDVVNRGEITAAAGGYVALIGPRVQNQGVISAQFGTIAFGAGNRATVDIEGGSLLSFAVEGAALGALAENRGDLIADGGMVVVDAQAKDALVDTVVNLDGVVRARSLEKRDGAIILSGGDEGVVRVSGSLDASGSGDGESGGKVHVLGETIALADGASVDVSGDAGGGEVLIGGDYQGKGGKPTSSRTFVAAGATIAADATTRGDGGRVVVWADGATAFHGGISARGGADGGDGGFVEVSGRQHLAYRGSTDLRAPKGDVGMLLLDPASIVISAGENRDIGWSGEDFLFATVGDPAISLLNVSTLADQLAQGNVTLTTASDGSGAGDITVEDGFGWTSDFDLALLADRDIQINAPVTKSEGGGSLVLRADRQGTGTGTVSFGESGKILFGGSAGDVSVFYNPVAYSEPDFETTKVTMGSGGLAAHMLVNTLEDLDNIRQNLSGTYALGRDIDASATATWNDGDGFDPIGSGGGPHRFSGVLDGQGQEISSIFINRPEDESVGLFGRTDDARIRRLGVADASITGGTRTGGLVGWMDGGVISDSRITGVVTGQNFVGGLVGLQDGGEIDQSFAAASVTGKQNVGGLVGRSEGFIMRSFAGESNTSGVRVLVEDKRRTYGDENPLLTFTLEAFAGGPRPMSAQSDIRVVGEKRVGGLVGWQHDGEISQSYATLPVTGEQDVGGLVGRQQTTGNAAAGNITHSYATGPVSGENNVGGFIGWRGTNQTVVASFWDRETTGQASGVGTGSVSGISGTTTAQSMQQATFADAGWDFNSTWEIAEGETYPSHLWAENQVAVLSNPVLATAAAQASPVGGYDILVSNRDALQAEADNANVRLTIANGTLTIDPRAVALLGSRTYDGTAQADAGILTVDNLVAGDALSLGGSAALAGADAGQQAITGLGTLALSGGAAGNYTLSGAGGTVTIDPRVVALLGQRPYDGTAQADAGILTVDNLVAGDALSLGGSAALAGADTGQQAIAGLGTLALSGGAAGNYTLSGAGGTVTIDPRVVALLGSRTYDGTAQADAGILTVDNLVAGDALSLGGSAALAGADAGQQAITGLGTLTLSGGAAGNYTLSGAGGTVTIDPRVVALLGQRPYDGTAQADAGILTVDNLVAGDALSLGGSAALAGADAGQQAITGLGTLALSGGAAGNYTLSGAGGTVIIDPAPPVEEETPQVPPSVAGEISAVQAASWEIVEFDNAPLVTPEDGLTGGAVLVAPEDGLSGGADLITPDETRGDASIVVPEGGEGGSGEAELVTGSGNNQGTGQTGGTASGEEDEEDRQ